MNVEEIRAELERRNIKRVKVGGFDVDGVLRGKYVHLDKFWSSLEGGFGFCDVVFGWDVADVLYDNAAVTGWDSGYPDAIAKIDLSTFRVLPSEPETACFLVDFYGRDGKPHPACPRSLLKSIAARAESKGFRACFAAEFEFWVFRETPESLDAKGFRGLDPLSPGMFGYSWVRQGQNQELVNELLETLEAFRIPVEGFHTETGPGVWEAAIRYSDVVEAADRAALFKTTLKQICHRRGLTVTFMAKWSAELPGSGGHLHQSLWDGENEKNLFASARSKDGLSDVARHYLGGLVSLAPEMTAFYAPTVNSYKRFVPGVWAPLTASWGIENRTCSVRVIPGGASTRVEQRQTGADINPYVAMAACLGSGMYGVENALEAPPAIRGDATATGAEGAKIPTTLDDAVRALEASQKAREILGEPFVDHYVRTRDWEARQARRAVSEWELRRYFEAI
jgi:glutamine synthetase